MTAYRVKIPVVLYVDIDADTRTDAVEMAEALADRMENGVDVPEFDTEIEGLHASLYPTGTPTVNYEIERNEEELT